MKIWSIDWTGFCWKVWFERTNEINDPDEYVVSGDFLVIFLFGLWITLDFSTEKKQEEVMEQIYILIDIADRVASRVVDEFLLQTSKKFLVPKDVSKYLNSNGNPEVIIDLDSIKKFKKILDTPYVEQNGSQQFTTLEWGKTIYWDLKKQKYYIKRRK